MPELQLPNASSQNLQSQLHSSQRPHVFHISKRENPASQHNLSKKINKSRYYNTKTHGRNRPVQISGKRNCNKKRITSSN